MNGGEVTMFTTYISGVEYNVLESTQYKNNCLYGKMGMHLVDEIPEEHLMDVILMPFSLGELSTRQTNRHLIIACLAVVRLDYLKNELPKITDGTLEKLILTGVKLLVKDLPIRKGLLITLYKKALIEAEIKV